uniref:DUF4408 domain-containing protein n=1 Tax=Elaeophora elaphi TaxID=1147741 RepID=A0A0R3S3W4_9BILA
MTSPAITSTTSTSENLLRTLPGIILLVLILVNFCLLNSFAIIFNLRMKILASSTSSDDERSTLPELTFIFNHTTTPFFHSKQPTKTMDTNLINGTKQLLSNITIEYIPQQMDHPK